jgi:hypothetical protein
VLRRLADEAVRPYGYSSLFGPAMSESQRIADGTARTCAYAHAAALRAVAEEFERVEREAPEVQR